ncbi:nucleotidyltransferase family protein [candidate division KSB1 bacterium]|nr:nucleotidyltransferase family protein [candidate division KSB1 bacterium]
MKTKPNKIAAIILAAGSGKRISQLGPKPLLCFEGKTFIEIALDRVTQAGCNPIKIITNAVLLPKLNALELKTDILVNPNPGMGMLSSIQCGIDALSREAGGFFLVPIDYPLVKLSTFMKIRAMHSRDPDAIIRPNYRGKSGHPVIFPLAMFDEFKKMTPQTAQNYLAQMDCHRCRDIDVDDPGININVNTSDIYFKFCAKKI